MAIPHQKEIIAIVVICFVLLFCNCVYTAAIGTSYSTTQKAQYSCGFTICACMVPAIAIIVLAMPHKGAPGGEVAPEGP
jgi:branched-subunit amino acid permease